MVSLLRWFEIKKYRYQIFLKNLPVFQQAIIASRIIHRKFLRLSVPDSLEIGVTYQCQLKCVHCGVSGQSKKMIAELSITEITNLIRKAQKLGIYFIIFSGGEPFMRKDVLEMVRYASRLGLITAFSTNGLSITPENAQQLRRHHVSFVNISIDSPDAQAHDALRGQQGCFEQVKESVRVLRMKGIPVIISTYVTKDNIQGEPLGKIIKLSRSWDAQGVRVLMGVPSGKWRGCFGNIVSQDEKKYVSSFLDPCYVYVEGVCNKFTECNAFLKKLFYVSPYGEVQPCSFVPFYFGNIREEELSVIWERMTRHSMYAQFDHGDCIMRNHAFISEYDKCLRNCTALPVRI